MPTYRLKKELGRGAMGVVYRVVHERLNRPVALKFRNPDVRFDGTIGAAQILERYRGERLEWLAAQFASERTDLIESDRVLTQDDPDAAGFKKILAGYRRSLKCQVGANGTRVLVAKVSWERQRMEPQTVERTLVLAPNAALGAQP